ncbi:MAG: tetratricopeptide repeat protein [Cyanobacteriota bacterium]|nr:tetratricopeptide repeat protein [Cyanobacteriota bacterium]
MGKLVVLKFVGNLEERGFRVELEVGRDGFRPDLEISGRLPPDLELVDLLKQWQEQYGQIEGRIKPKRIRYDVSTDDVRQSARRLGDRLATWLDSPEFRPIDKGLRDTLGQDEAIRVLIRTKNRLLQKLPWHLWDAIESRLAEVALSPPKYQKPPKTTRHPNTKVRILAILGHSQGIDVEADRKLLENLPNAEVVFLVEPKSQDIHQNLWQQSWDIIFFAGHSETDPENRGRIYINATDSLTLEQLCYGLRQSVKQGLQLAIFNSCDGLGLTDRLEDLQIPQAIVMRELVPDRVAQAFLTHFLMAFVGGRPFYLAVRQAREQLQGLEAEFPCATWLPVIFQNPAVIPPNWNDLFKPSMGEEGAKISPENLEDRPDSKDMPKIRAFEFFAFPVLDRHPVVKIALLSIGLVVSAIGWQFGRSKLAIITNDRGFEYYRSGQLPEARKYLELAHKIDPDNRSVLYTLGYFCESTKNWECARKYYRRSAERGMASAYSNLGRLYILEDKDYAAAVDLLWQGLEFAQHDPIRYSILKNLGWARLQQGRDREAIEHLKAAIELDEERAAAYCLLAQTSDNLGNQSEAIAQWQTCLDLAQPQIPDEDVWIGMAHRRLQEIDKK